MGFFDNVNGAWQNVKNTVSFGLSKYVADPIKSVALGAWGVAKDVVTTLHQDARDLVSGAGGIITGARNAAVSLGGQLINKTGDTVQSLGQSLSTPLVVVGGAIAAIFLLKK